MRLFLCFIFAIILAPSPSRAAVDCDPELNKERFSRLEKMSQEEADKALLEASVCREAFIRKGDYIGYRLHLMDQERYDKHRAEKEMAPYGLYYYLRDKKRILDLKSRLLSEKEKEDEENDGAIKGALLQMASFRELIGSRKIGKKTADVYAALIRNEIDLNMKKCTTYEKELVELQEYVDMSLYAMYCYEYRGDV